MEEARRSRRPSRYGLPAGTSRPSPPRGESGFDQLLDRVLARARAATTLEQALEVLLSLDGHVPVEVARKALTEEERAAIEILFGAETADGEPPETDGAGAGAPDEPPVFIGTLALATTGKVVLTVPTRRQAPATLRLAGIVARVPWPRQKVTRYEERALAIRRAETAEVAACREWLSQLDLAELLADLRNAARRTAPFVLYRGGNVYTNFREPNNLVGNTLSPEHPDCVLRGLEHLPLRLWSEADLVLVACLAILIRSGGYGRIEECNSSQLGLGPIARLFAEKWRAYRAAGAELPPAADWADAAGGAGGALSVGSLVAAADQLRQAREELRRSRQFYREIHGALLHKIERIVTPPPPAQPERDICARLRATTPLRGETLAELVDAVRADDEWLLAPRGSFGTGLEHLICELVLACRDVVGTDFAMSRGMRSLPQLVAALRAQEWERIVEWELPAYFCCVVPAPSALAHFGGDTTRVADAAAAISARMQYNSWHFLPGNLPRVPVVEARDHFVPPTMPDLAYFSDLHHRGHVANRVRYSIRSPQPVTVLDRRLAGFVDLRLLRCVGPPFEERDLVVAHRASTLIAAATEQVALAVAAGAEATVTAFDHVWHLHWIKEQLAGEPVAAGDPPVREEQVVR